MCYISGSLIGRTKLFERISPKKTVEGLIGGMVLSLTLVFFYDRILALLSGAYHLQTAAYSNVQWVFIGLVTLVFATFGDLVESQLKRSLNIKDSGSIMPGHGGFLDRLDAILVAIPFSVLAIWLVDQINNILLLKNFLS
jgi:phosphatidate cytidylyltransferase